MKIYVLALGCPKGTVDVEASLGLLRRSGCSFTEDPEEADLLLVSSCSFLKSAWEETVEEVERLSGLKRAKGRKKLVLMGCLPKHRNLDLKIEFPDVDFFIPPGGHGHLPKLVESWQGICSEYRPRYPTGPALDPFAGYEVRELLTPRHTAYIKIAEGCNHRCAYCSIPIVKGPLVLRPAEGIRREAERLLEAGVREVTLLAQDTASYNYSGTSLPELAAILARSGIDWIRIMYVHPASIRADELRLIFENPSVCRYLDVPIQHASDRILERMGRPYNRKYLEELFLAIKSAYPDLVLRSEVIVGFPGEGDDDFEILRSFVSDVGFSSLGIFPFSLEPGTQASRFDDDVPRGIKMERAAEMSSLQESVSFALNNSYRGRSLRVLVDREVGGEDTGFSGCRYAGRFYGQAYSVDGEVYLEGRGIVVGDFITAKIRETDIFDMKGVVA